MPSWLFARGVSNAANTPEPGVVWLPEDMCGPSASTDAQAAGVQSGLSFFTGGDSYMPRTQCMVTATGETDWLWVGMLLAFNLVVIVGYLRIFLFWRRAYLAEDPRDRNPKLMDLARIFMFCAVCGYVSSIVLFFWPAYRLLALMLIPLGIFTWRFAWNLEPFREALGAKRYRRELHEELERRNEELERRVDLATERLRAAVCEANHAKQAKERFLANMSHEIRTPMTAIIGFCDAIAGDRSLDPMSRDHLGIVRDNGKHLLGVINDILDQAKIESGEIGIESVVTDIRSEAQEIVDTIGPQAEKNGNRLTVSVSSEVPRLVMTDPVRLRQILFNLVANANKFTSDGFVSVGVSVHGRGAQGSTMLAIEVADSGVGMSQGEVDHCFNRFNQADYSTERKFGGSGLGLSIARELAQAMGGDITVRSELGAGTTFVATIDVQQATDGEEIERAVQPVAQASNRLAGLSLVFVDDSPDNRRLVSFWLRRAGADVVVAEGGQEGADLVIDRDAEGRAFDLVLMDLHMPGVNGAEAIRAIRDAGLTTPVIVLSADVMPEGREVAFAAGANAYVNKPIDFPALIEQIAGFADSGARDAA